jgi:hypothetical protein
VNKNKLAVVVLLALSANRPSQAQDAVSTAKHQEKVSLASLVNIVSSGANLYQTLSSWASVRFRRPTTEGTSSSTPATGLAPPNAPIAAVGVPYTQAPSYSPALVIMGIPDIGLSAATGGIDPASEWDSHFNYQGVTISALILDAQMRVLETRSLASPLRGGERFKLRVLSTDDALVSLDALQTAPDSVGSNGVLNAAPNYNGQMYPASAGQVVQVKGGDVVLLPMGDNEYFTFDEKAGTNLLALHVRHPLAKPASINLQPLYRQDSALTSTYSQLTRRGSYLALTQLIALQPNR